MADLTTLLLPGVRPDQRINVTVEDKAKAPVGCTYISTRAASPEFPVTIFRLIQRSSAQAREIICECVEQRDPTNNTVGLEIPATNANKYRMAIKELVDAGFLKRIRANHYLARKGKTTVMVHPDFAFPFVVGAGDLGYQKQKAMDLWNSL